MAVGSYTEGTSPAPETQAGRAIQGTKAAPGGPDVSTMSDEDLQIYVEEQSSLLATAKEKREEETPPPPNQDEMGNEKVTGEAGVGLVDKDGNFIGDYNKIINKVAIDIMEKLPFEMGDDVMVTVPSVLEAITNGVKEQTVKLRLALAGESGNVEVEESKKGFSDIYENNKALYEEMKGGQPDLGLAGEISAETVAFVANPMRKLLPGGPGLKNFTDFVIRAKAKGKSYPEAFEDGIKAVLAGKIFEGGLKGAAALGKGGVSLAKGTLNLLKKHSMDPTKAAAKMWDDVINWSANRMAKGINMPKGAKKKLLSKIDPNYEKATVDLAKYRLENGVESSNINTLEKSYELMQEAGDKIKGVITEVSNALGKRFDIGKTFFKQLERKVIAPLKLSKYSDDLEIAGEISKEMRLLNESGPVTLQTIQDFKQRLGSDIPKLFEKARTPGVELTHAEKAKVALWGNLKGWIDARLKGYSRYMKGTDFKAKYHMANKEYQKAKISNQIISTEIPNDKLNPSIMSKDLMGSWLVSSLTSPVGSVGVGKGVQAGATALAMIARRTSQSAEDTLVPLLFKHGVKKKAEALAKPGFFTPKSPPILQSIGGGVGGSYPTGLFQPKE